MKLKSKVLIHIFFWIYIINQTLFPFYISNDQAFNEYYPEIIIYIVTSWITFYIVYFSIPSLFSLKYKIISVFIGLALIAILVSLRVGLEFLFWRFIDSMKECKVVNITATWWYNSLRVVIIMSIYSLLIRLAVGWFETQKLKSDLILQTKASELALLRSQVNPHFLFNTLNNIYSLVYKKSDDAPAAVMKMAAIMRYVLYDATTDKVLLEKEIEYLQSFIELQQLRTRQKGFVDLTIKGSIEGRTIAPMLLIPFVENAFKHGSKKVPPPGIRINLILSPETVIFEVSNYLRKNSFASKDKSAGIGLNNIRRRLALLYPGKHSLDTWEDQDQYYVKLKIEQI